MMANPEFVKLVRPDPIVRADAVANVAFNRRDPERMRRFLEDFGFRRIDATGPTTYFRGHGEHFSEELAPVLVVSEIETGRRLIDQVLQIRLGGAQSFTISLPAVPSNKCIGIFALVHHHHIDVKPFGYQELTRSSGSALSGSVWIETQDHALRKAVEQSSLFGR